MLQLARPEDHACVERLARQVHQMHVTWRPDIYEMPEQLYTAEQYAQALAEKQLYVAKQDNVVLGYVKIKIRRYDWPGVVKRKVLLIDELGVDEQYRNHGIGTQMMEDVKALARAFCCTDLQLGVYPQNDDAVAFYRKCGFIIRSIDMQMKI